MKTRSLILTLAAVIIVLAVSISAVIVNYATIVNNKNSFIETQKNTISAADSEIQALKVEQTNLTDQVLNLQEQISQVQNWLNGNRTAYSTQVSSLNSQLTNLNGQLTALQGQIVNLEAQNATLNNQITALSSQISSYLSATNNAIPTVQQLAPQVQYINVSQSPPVDVAALFNNGVITGQWYLYWNNSWKTLVPIFVWSGSESFNANNLPPFEPETMYIFQWIDSYGNVDNSFSCNIRSTPTPGIYGVELSNMDGANGIYIQLMLGANRVFPIFPGSDTTDAEPKIGYNFLWYDSNNDSIIPTYSTG
jgi:cell division protein FtsB